MRIAMGLDGGGTKTECVLMDESGRTLGRGRGGPSNSSRIGVEAAARGVREAATAALENAGLSMTQVKDVCAGLAGVALAERAQAMTDLLRPFFGGARFELCTDLDLALAAALATPAIVLVAGTGSAAIGKDASGRIFRSGGHGPKKSDEGSAFAIGKKAVIELASDSSEEKRDLKARALDHLGVASFQGLTSLEGAEADAVYPRIFPVIVSEADRDDPFAMTLLQQAAENLAELVADVESELQLAETTFVLGKTGGMIARSTYFDEQLDANLRRVAPKAELRHLTTPLAEVAAKRVLGL
jgi:N-acetylglucosamine kinase-like BadF-type ATPase